MGRQEKGLTLLELLFSMALFALVVTGSAYGLTRAHQLSEESRERLLALNAARSVMEQVKDTSLANVGGINPVPFLPADLPGSVINIITNPNPIGIAPSAVITVRVQWNGLQNQLEISTVKSQFS